LAEILLFPGTWRLSMKFYIEVGRNEKHLIEFSFNQLLGETVIKVNHREVKRTRRLFNEPVTEAHVIHIDDKDQITVRVEKERKPLFGEKFRVYLNDRLYQCYEGM